MPLAEEPNNLQPMELLSLHNSNSFGLLQQRPVEDLTNKGIHPSLYHLPCHDSQEDEEKFMVELQSPDPQSLLQELDSEYQRLIANLTLERNNWNEDKQEHMLQNNDILNNQVC